MKFALERTGAPATEVMTTAEAKTHMRVTSSADDTYIDAIVAAARQHTEEYLGRSLIMQTWKLYLDCFPDTIELPRGPVSSVTSIEYLDTAGASQTLSTDVYRVDLKSIYPRITTDYGQVWPSTRDVINSVTVTYVTGYGSAASDIPTPIIQAIKLLVGHLYENREATSAVVIHDVPLAYHYLLSSYRVPRF
ncbi:MAG: head-tail connector protein [Pseudomonadales bacterium]|nr:head-tail connector protein [Pseudomonadales bacterium]